MILSTNAATLKIVAIIVILIHSFRLEFGLLRLQQACGHDFQCGERYVERVEAEVEAIVHVHGIISFPCGFWCQFSRCG